MERRKAIATAAAITMSAVSAIFAFGVSSAALGTQNTQSTPAPQALSQPAVAPTASPVPLQARARQRPTRRSPKAGRVNRPRSQTRQRTPQEVSQMTEHADNTDQAERIRRLQERRAASGTSRATRHPEHVPRNPSTRPPRPRLVRRPRPEGSAVAIPPPRAGSCWPV